MKTIQGQGQKKKRRGGTEKKGIGEGKRKTISRDGKKRFRSGSTKKRLKWVDRKKRYREKVKTKNRKRITYLGPKQEKKSLEGQLACDSQATIAALLFDPSMSALSIPASLEFEVALLMLSSLSILWIPAFSLKGVISSSV